MKKFSLRILLIILIPALLAIGISRSDAAFSTFRVLMGASGSSVVGDEISYAFDGTGDEIWAADHTDWDVFGSTATNRTISFWVKHTDHAGTEGYVAHSESIGPNNHWQFYHADGYGITFLVQSSSTTIIALGGGGGAAEITDTNWHHVVLAKVLDEYGLYKDGVQIAYVQDTSTVTFAGKLGWGMRDIDSGIPFDGNLDDMIIYHGNLFSAAPNVGLSNTIDVPTVQHTSDANTKLLIHCGETKTGTTGSGATFTDSGDTGHTVTENGNAIEDAVNYKW